MQTEQLISLIGELSRKDKINACYQHCCLF
jgi:hypothetical protein